MTLIDLFSKQKLFDILFWWIFYCKIKELSLIIQWSKTLLRNLLQCNDTGQISLTLKYLNKVKALMGSDRPGSRSRQIPAFFSDYYPGLGN